MVQRAVTIDCDICNCTFHSTTETWFKYHRLTAHPQYPTGYSKYEIDKAMIEINALLAPDKDVD